MIKISLLKPTLTLSSTTFDASLDFEITFSSMGSQVYANEIEIFLNSNNNLVYSNKTIVPTFSLSQTIPANTLTNNAVYKIHLRTYDSEGNYSVYSDYVLISCYNNAVVDITNITNNGTIDNQSWDFLGSYIQTQNLPIQSYQFTLYDNNMTEIADSGTLYDQLLQFQYTGFENNKSYYIKLTVISQYGITTSITKKFQAQYVLPSFTNFVSLTNNPTQATIDVEIIAIRTLGHISSGTVTIENGDFANTLSGTVTFDDANGLQVKSSDWTAQLWVTSLAEGAVINSLYGQNNTRLDLVYSQGQIHGYKYINDIQFSHYRSNAINATSNNVVYIFCQSINGRITLQCEILS